MKRNTLLQIIGLVIVAMLALGVSLLLRSQSKEQKVEAAAPVEMGSTVVETVVASPEKVDTTDKIETSPDVDKRAKMVSGPETITQRVNAIEVTASNFRGEESTVYIDVCYTIPDNGDWAVKDAVLMYGDKVRKLTGGSLIELVHWPVDGKQKVYDFRKTNPDEIVKDVDANEENVPHRCDTVYFEGVGSDADLSNVTFMVSTIYAHPRETEYCDAKYLDKVHNALDAKKMKIKVKCKTEESIIGLEVVEKPAELSDAEANNFITSEDFLIDLHGIRGPWIFETSIQ